MRKPDGHIETFNKSYHQKIFGVSKLTLRLNYHNYDKNYFST